MVRRRRRQPAEPAVHAPLSLDERTAIERELADLDLRLAAGALRGVVDDALALELRLLGPAGCLRPARPPRSASAASCEACVARLQLADAARQRRARARLAAAQPYQGRVT